MRSDICHGSAPLYEATPAKLCGVPDPSYFRSHSAICEDHTSYNRVPSLCGPPPFLPGVSFLCDGRPSTPCAYVGPPAVYSSTIQPVGLPRSQHGTVTCTGGVHIWQGAQRPEYQPLCCTGQGTWEVVQGEWTRVHHWKEPAGQTVCMGLLLKLCTSVCMYVCICRCTYCMYVCE